MAPHEPHPPRKPSYVYDVGTEPDPRFSLANERTFLSWVRTALALLAGAVALHSLQLPQTSWLRGIVVVPIDYRSAPSLVDRIGGIVSARLTLVGDDVEAAALNPAQTDYLFFVAKTLNPADGHAFAATLEEHNRNVEAFRALEKAAAAGGE